MSDISDVVADSNAILESVPEVTEQMIGALWDCSKKLYETLFNNDGSLNESAVERYNPNQLRGFSDCFEKTGRYGAVIKLNPV